MIQKVAQKKKSKKIKHRKDKQKQILAKNK